MSTTHSCHADGRIGIYVPQGLANIFWNQLESNNLVTSIPHADMYNATGPFTHIKPVPTDLVCISLIRTYGLWINYICCSGLRHGTFLLLLLGTLGYLRHEQSLAPYNPETRAALTLGPFCCYL